MGEMSFENLPTWLVTFALAIFCETNTFPLFK
jgi:hypothetical protein